jgi:peroxiredoxin/predicted 2-oxoglutarate/Fe(II)-dependent dioxygenase YbiX
MLGMNQLVGKPLLLLFYAPDAAASHVAPLQGFAGSHAGFAELGVQVVAIGIESADQQTALTQQQNFPFPLLSDADGKVSAAFGAGGGGGLRKVLLIAPITRVMADYPIAMNGALAETILSDARQRLMPEPARQIIQQAPVLLIPDALPKEMCQRLIHAWEAEGHEETGSVKNIEGKAVRVVDHSHKIRSDHYLKTNGELNNAVVAIMARRVLPEIQIAYNYQVTQFEDFRVGCYDAGRGGYFRPHRDNTTPTTAQRKFAMSLLLNDDYEGGHLRFPEYGPHLYRPAAGGAVIFSCSLLHEATDVTAGRRFVLLSFYW